MRTPDLAVARDLCAFIAASPSPFHAVEQAAQRLAGAGFDESIDRGRRLRASRGLDRGLATGSGTRSSNSA